MADKNNRNTGTKAAKAAAAELAVENAIDRLAVNFGLEAKDSVKIMVVGVSKDDGATFTAAGLWKALGGNGEKVLLLDADMRDSHMGEQLGIDGTPATGLVQMLADGVIPEMAECAAAPDGCGVVLSGTAGDGIRINRLLSGDGLTRALDVFAGQFDRIIVDAPPLADAPDALQIAAACDGVVLVVRAGRTKQDAVSKYMEALGKTGTPVLGVVLNRVNTAGEGLGRLFRRKRK